MPIEQPKITQRGEETIASHPAFGQIGASRVSGLEAITGGQLPLQIERKASTTHG